MDYKKLEQNELAVFWNEIASHLPKSLERSTLGDEKIFLAFKIAYPEIRRQLIKAVLDEVERKLLILHNHNSVPNYIDNLDEGCVVCAENNRIKQLIKSMYGKE